MANLQALIFDVDGTIAETERDGHRVAFNQTFAAAGLDWHWDEALYGELLQVAGGKERMQYYRDRTCPDYTPPLPLAEWLADLHQAKSALYQEIITAGQVKLRPGIRRLILAARSAGIRLAIATTSAPDNAIALIQATLGADSPSWFEVIAAGDVVPNKKPAPDIYHYVLAQLHLPPAACLVVEDSEAGLVAATEAGLTTVITVHDYTRNQDFTAAALVLDHLGDPDQPCTAIAGNLPAPLFDLAIAAQLLASPTQR